MTENLAGIILVINIGGKSGMLSVERGEAESFEEGFILFANGQPVEAGVGLQRGAEAFAYLNNWQVCRYSFANQKDTTSSSSRSTQSFPSVNTYMSQTASSSNSNLPTYPAYTNTQHYFARLRTPLGDEISRAPEKMNLPRIHRRLLLLINGQRHTEELSRLMARTPKEIEKLLNDLEQIGLLQ